MYNRNLDEIVIEWLRANIKKLKKPIYKEFCIHNIYKEFLNEYLEKNPESSIECIQWDEKKKEPYVVTHLPF